MKFYFKSTRSLCQLLYLPSLVTLLYGCAYSDATDSYSELLKNSGENKKELLKVINHYSQSSNDSLKLKAALFLIENMDGMVTLDSACVADNRKYFDFISGIDRSKLVFPVLTRGVDSINRKLGLIPPNPDVKFLDELKTISAPFLIKNIDSAFFVWQNRPWARKLSFEDFCEYILPYRCTDTYCENVRDFFLNRFASLPDSIKYSDKMIKVGEYIINNLKPWFKEDPNIVGKYPFLVPMKFADLLKARVGDCKDANSVRVAALRAMGVAATLDEIPNWGNSNLPHYWYRIIDPLNDTVKSKITNRNEDRHTQHIITATSYDEPFFPGTPPEIQISYGRTVPKVYRQCFSRQKTSLGWIADTNEIPPYFQNIHLKDVTSEYVETASVSVSVKAAANSPHFIYLCVFDNLKWVPVAWAALKDAKAEFKNMGKNIIYLPAYYSKGKIVPAANPFLVTLEGNAENITAGNPNETVKLFTKFPVRSYVLKWESYVTGARFQLANKQDLSDSTTVYTIQKLPFYETEILLNTPGKARFLVFQFNGIKYMEVSELEFFGFDSTGNEVKLKGKPIGNPGYYPYQWEKLFDGIPYNFYRADTSLTSRYVGLDLGEKNATRITRIKYMPYTDDNAVRKGDIYRLLYWDNGWRVVADMKAEANYVNFKNVPVNALLLLVNTQGGVQQRIFMYKGNKQLFW